MGASLLALAKSIYYVCLPEIKMKSLPIVVKRRNHPGSTTHIHQQNEGYRWPKPNAYPYSQTQ